MTINSLFISDNRLRLETNNEVLQNSINISVKVEKQAPKPPKSLGFFSRWIPMTLSLNGEQQHVSLKINSLASKLGIATSEIKSIYNRNGAEGIISELKKRIELEETVAKKTADLKSLSHSLNDEELKNLVTYVEKNKDRFPNGAYLRRKETGLARTVEFCKDGSIYIHLNTKDDALLGKGQNKKAKYTIAYNTPRLCARTTHAYEGPDEIEALKKLKNVDGVANVDHFRFFKSKNGETKLEFIMPLYEGGTLHSALKNGTDLDRVKIGETLLITLCRMEEEGVVHCDLHCGNIFLTKSGEPKIADFGSASATDEEITTNSHSSPEAPPEFQSMNTIRATSKIDVYSMGRIFLKLFGKNSAYQPLIEQMLEKPISLRPFPSEALEMYQSLTVSNQ